mmetsp:Transcript_16906/g.30680  ORF Transcript_16906/g.30680 Transcript_16906/m.30680 type:complete len:144 (+) Transcript_16906:271-702(+)
MELGKYTPWCIDWDGFHFRALPCFVYIAISFDQERRKCPLLLHTPASALASLVMAQPAPTPLSSSSATEPSETAPSNEEKSATPPISTEAKARNSYRATLLHWICYDIGETLAQAGRAGSTRKPNVLRAWSCRTSALPLFCLC